MKLAIKLFVIGSALLTQTGLAQSWSTNTLPSGLVAWWAAEGNAADATCNHYDGTASGGVTYVLGRSGSGVAFDGTSGVITVPDNPGLRLGSALTLEFWAKRQRLDGIDIVLEKGGDWNTAQAGEANYGTGLHTINNRMFYFFFKGGWRGTSGVADFGWHHYAIVATNGTANPGLYIDGVHRPIEFSQGAATLNLYSSTRPLHIAAQLSPGWNYYGNNVLDETRIYNRGLSAAEIAYVYQGPTPPVTQGLKLHLDASDVNASTNTVDGALVTLWHDLSGFGLDATPLFGVAPVYRTNALNGRAGVDFGQSGSDALATAFSSQFNFTNCTIFMVGDEVESFAHVSISAAAVNQEFILGHKAIYHHSSGYHWVNRNHQDSPTNYYIQAGLFGVRSNELANCINGVFSTNRLFNSWEIGQGVPVADYVSIARQAILGWRNSDALGNAPLAIENFNGVICEVLVYDRQLGGAELDAMNFYLAGKYSLAVAAIPPTLQVQLTAATAVALSWGSTAGRTYQLQTSTNLSVANWLNLGAPFPGTGGVLGTNFPINTAPQKFFRLQLGN